MGKHAGVQAWEGGATVASVGEPVSWFASVYLYATTGFTCLH